MGGLSKVQRNTTRPPYISQLTATIIIDATWATMGEPSKDQRNSTILTPQDLQYNYITHDAHLRHVFDRGHYLYHNRVATDRAQRVLMYQGREEDRRSMLRDNKTPFLSLGLH